MIEPCVRHLTDFRPVLIARMPMSLLGGADQRELSHSQRRSENISLDPEFAVRLFAPTFNRESAEPICEHEAPALPTRLTPPAAGGCSNTKRE